MMRLEVKAPFAAFRTFTAGSFRPTARFLTPTAAYGLALNLAGIESRHDDGISPMTLTRTDLPAVRIALGSISGRFPTVQGLYQQLHNYPVGASGAQFKGGAYGSKYNITPARREFLCDLHVCLALDGNRELEARIRSTLADPAQAAPSRYGLPFAGDNAFLIDVIRPFDESLPVRWMCAIPADALASQFPWTTRLTTWIDRRDLSRTRSKLFAPIEGLSAEIPDDAWTEVGPT